MFNARHFGILGILGILLAAVAPRAAAQCASGLSIGQITLPNPGTVGSVDGQLILGQTGPTLYRLTGTLFELSPTPSGMRTGTIDGYLFSNNAIDYVVRGRWFANALGQGFFRCVVFEVGPNGKRVGRVGGNFPPPPGPLAYSNYEGSWLICP